MNPLKSILRKGLIEFVINHIIIRSKPESKRDEEVIRNKYYQPIVEIANSLTRIQEAIKKNI